MKPVYILIDSVTVIRANAFTLKLAHEWCLSNVSFESNVTSRSYLTGKLLLFRWPNHVSFLRFTRIDIGVSLVIISKVLIGILSIFFLFLHILMMLFWKTSIFLSRSFLYVSFSAPYIRHGRIYVSNVFFSFSWVFSDLSMLLWLCCKHSNLCWSIFQLLLCHCCCL